MLMQASHQWATRPPEERFTSLPAMRDAATNFRSRSTERRVANRDVKAHPIDGDAKGIALNVNGMIAVPSHWAFGGVCGLIGAPAGYLRRLPIPMIADCLNFGLQVERKVEEIGSLITMPGDGEPDGTPAMLTAATGPSYGRVWNDDVLNKLIDRFGDGVPGHGGKFTVPGEFGKAVEVDNGNTTLYRSDRDMFVFLADETNRIEIPNRRNGQPGSLARGFFLWNSEVGSTTLGIATFLFDYVCCNRMVWGSTEFAEIRVRHTAGAPHRWIEEVAPALEVYANAGTHNIVEAVVKAQAARIGDGAAVEKFLTERFNSANTAKAIMLAHEAEEGRPIESLWDATTGTTAYAKGLSYTADRVDMERAGGKLLTLAE